MVVDQIWLCCSGVSLATDSVGIAEHVMKTNPQGHLTDLIRFWGWLKDLKSSEAVFLPARIEPP